VVASAQAQIGSVGERDLLVLGVALYWAEGAKRKPWAAREGHVRQQRPVDCADLGAMARSGRRLAGAMPVTPRRNTRPGYRGCLAIDVLQSAELYRRVEGWWTGLSSVP
jgi:hypothetical protein